MALYITQVGKQKFVCGLFWQSLSQPRKLMKEAVELGRKIDSDLYVLRMDQTTAQAGFGHTRDGGRKGLFSLGAVVSKTLAIEGAHYDGEQQPVHNWLAALKLPDEKWAYFAVRDANFLPNGDFAGTKEEVLERLHGDYGLGGWNVVIGDAELSDYGFHNFNAKRIEDLVPHKADGSVRVHNWWRLRQIDAKVSRIAIAAGCAAVLAAGIGGFSYWKHYQNQQAEANRARAVMAAQAKKLGVAPPTVPWANQPAPEATARACVDQLQYLQPGGWILDEYVCTAQQATYSWSRQGSTVGYLLAQVPQATPDLSGDKATLSETLRIELGKAEALLPQVDLLRPVVSELQRAGLSPRISQLPSQAATPSSAGAPSQQAPVPDWKTFAFSIDARGVAPVEVARILNLAGVRIQKLVYRRGDWSIEGVMYAQ